MGELKFNLKNVREKIKNVTRQLKDFDLNDLEKEKLQLSLVAYFGILDSSGSFTDTIFPSFLDKITKGKYSVNRDSKRICKTGEIVLNKDSIGIMTPDYLSFLIQLSQIIQKPQLEETKFNSLNMPDRDFKNMALNFYSQLDSEISEKVRNIFSMPNLINVSSSSFRANNNGSIACGITYYDYVYNVPYCTTTKEGTFRDIQVFVHELMHAVDFLMQPKILSKNYYGFHETPTYCTDLLFADYLEENHFAISEVNKIRSERIDYIRGLASKVLYQIKAKLNYRSLDECSIDEIFSVIDEGILKKLLEVQSGIMAIGLYNQIKQNKEVGISNLKTFMKLLLPKNKIPDFSNIRLDNDKLIEICQNVVSFDNVELGRKPNK